MINKIISVLISLSLCINTCFAQENNSDTFLDNDAPMLWQPAELETNLGDYQLTLYIMPVDGMVTPVAGYLLKKYDYEEIKRVMDNLAEEFARIRQEERTQCDALLADKDKNCRDLNKELLDKLDYQKKEILVLTKDKDDLKNDIFWWKIGALGTGVLSITAIIVSSLK